MANIGIIGAGIAGLASAVRLATQGHQVTVFEANGYPGGKLSAFELGAYRFDAGPSLFTMPQYVEDLFREAGVDSQPYFQYRSMEAACHYFWDDGTILHAWTDQQRFALEVEQQLGVPARDLLSFLARSKKKYETAGRIFLEKSLHRLDTWLNLKVLRSLLRLPAFDLFSSMHQVHERWFKNPKMVQLFDRYATYNGSDPYRAPGMLTIIPHFEHGIGTYYPEGGMHRITQAIYELSLKLGVQYQFNTPVERILTENGSCAGLIAGGQSYRFDQVVSNMDVYFTYKKLLPELRHPERILRQPKSSSALIFYWGIKHSFPELDLHNIFFSNDYQAEFGALGRGEVTEDPTVYINITSKYTPSDAPENCENWFVMVNVPCHQGQDWSALIPRIRQNVLDKLSRRLNIDIASLIEEEDILEPREIERKTSSHLGALYGYSSNNTMSAFLRHPNFARRIPNLYFVGGSVHPGGGIPLCLLSAKIMSEQIK